MLKILKAIVRDVGDPHLIIWGRVVNGLLASFFWPSRVRVQLLRLFGLSIDRTAVVRPGVIFRSQRVSVGPSTYIGYRALFDVRSNISIGRNVGIGSHTIFVDGEHSIDDPTRRAGRGSSSPITIGDGARISTQTMVLSGVTIGDGAVIGAGSLVTKDCEPHALYVGRPAKKIRDLPRD